MINEDEAGGTPDDSTDRDVWYLHLDQPRMRVVGTAHCYPKDTVIHGMPIPNDHVKVSVLSVVSTELATPVPVFDNEVTILNSAVNSFILWPKRLVLKTQQEAPRKPKIKRVIKTFVFIIYYSFQY